MKKPNPKPDAEPISPLPYPNIGLSLALQRTIKAKIERGELDEVKML